MAPLTMTPISNNAFPAADAAPKPASGLERCAFVHPLQPQPQPQQSCSPSPSLPSQSLSPVMSLLEKHSSSPRGCSRPQQQPKRQESFSLSISNAIQSLNRTLDEEVCAVSERSPSPPPRAKHAMLGRSYHGSSDSISALEMREKAVAAENVEEGEGAAARQLEALARDAAAAQRRQHRQRLAAVERAPSCRVGAKAGGMLGNVRALSRGMSWGEEDQQQQQSPQSEGTKQRLSLLGSLLGAMGEEEERSSAESLLAMPAKGPRASAANRDEGRTEFERQRQQRHRQEQEEQELKEPVEMRKMRRAHSVTYSSGKEAFHKTVLGRRRASDCSEHLGRRSEQLNRTAGATEASKAIGRCIVPPASDDDFIVARSNSLLPQKPSSQEQQQPGLLGGEDNDGGGEKSLDKDKSHRRISSSIPTRKSGLLRAELVAKFMDEQQRQGSDVDEPEDTPDEHCGWRQQLQCSKERCNSNTRAYYDVSGRHAASSPPSSSFSGAMLAAGKGRRRHASYRPDAIVAIKGFEDDEDGEIPFVAPSPPKATTPYRPPLPDAIAPLKGFEDDDKEGDEYKRHGVAAHATRALAAARCVQGTSTVPDAVIPLKGCFDEIDDRSAGSHRSSGSSSRGGSRHSGAEKRSSIITAGGAFVRGFAQSLTESGGNNNGCNAPTTRKGDEGHTKNKDNSDDANKPHHRGSVFGYRHNDNGSRFNFREERLNDILNGQEEDGEEEEHPHHNRANSLIVCDDGPVVVYSAVAPSRPKPDRRQNDATEEEHGDGSVDGNLCHGMYSDENRASGGGAATAASAAADYCSDSTFFSADKFTVVDGLVTLAGAAGDVALPPATLTRGRSNGQKGGGRGNRRGSIFSRLG